MWLGGTIGWDDYLAMSERLAGEVADPRGRNPTLVVCEFEPSITVGRLGSRSDSAFPTTTCGRGRWR